MPKERDLMAEGLGAKEQVLLTGQEWKLEEEEEEEESSIRSRRRAGLGTSGAAAR